MCRLCNTWTGPMNQPPTTTAAVTAVPVHLEHRHSVTNRWSTFMLSEQCWTPRLECDTNECRLQCLVNMYFGELSTVVTCGSACACTFPVVWVVRPEFIPGFRVFLDGEFFLVRICNVCKFWKCVHVYRVVLSQFVRPSEAKISREFFCTYLEKLEQEKLKRLKNSAKSVLKPREKRHYRPHGGIVGPQRRN